MGIFVKRLMFSPLWSCLFVIVGVVALTDRPGRVVTDDFMVQPLAGNGPERFQDRRTLVLENLALRQQLMIWQRHSRKPKIHESDRLFWVVYSRLVKG